MERRSPGRKAPIKYIVCNGDEGDPGAFMDCSVMEGDPHRMLEGMMIAGRACGARDGYIYVRAEYPMAVEQAEDRHSSGTRKWVCWAKTYSAAALISICI